MTVRAVDEFGRLDILVANAGAAVDEGSIALRTANGLVVDSLNYGGVTDPWLAEGYQGKSGSGQAGRRTVSSR